jgi:hypothetical protein
MTHTAACCGALLAALALHGVAVAGGVDVFPGPGTPLQDAIDAAADGDLVVLHAGTYPEAINIDKPLRLRVKDKGDDVLIDASATGASAAVDITANGVSIVGRRLPAEPAQPGWLRIGGGTAQAIRAVGVSNLRLKNLVTTLNIFTPNPPQPTGLLIAGSVKVNVKRAGFGGTDVGVHLDGIPAGAGIKFSYTGMGGADQAVGQGDDGVGLLIEDSGIGSSLGAAGIRIGPGSSISGGGIDLALRNSDGILFLGARIRTVQGYPVTAIDLDATSDNNRFVNVTVIGDVLDAGSGNCGKSVNHPEGTGTLAPCP